MNRAKIDQSVYLSVALFSKSQQRIYWVSLNVGIVDLSTYLNSMLGIQISATNFKIRHRTRYYCPFLLLDLTAFSLRGSHGDVNVVIACVDIWSAWQAWLPYTCGPVTCIPSLPWSLKMTATVTWLCGIRYQDCNSSSGNENAAML